MRSEEEIESELEHLWEKRCAHMAKVTMYLEGKGGLKELFETNQYVAACTLRHEFDSERNRVAELAGRMSALLWVLERNEVPLFDDDYIQ